MSDTLRILAITPGLLQPSILTAAYRAGGTGILDFEYVDDIHLAACAIQRVNGTKTPFGIRAGQQSSLLLQELLDTGTQYLRVLVLTSLEFVQAADCIRAFQARGIKVLTEATSIAQAALGESLGADGVVAKGHEAGGRVADETTFILLQRFTAALRCPVWAYGGIGLHTAAACAVAGAGGIVLDAQLALTRESPLPERTKAAIRTMDGSETVCLGEQLGEAYRFYYRPGQPAVTALQQTEAKLSSETLPKEEVLCRWRDAVALHTGLDTDKDAVMLGQDAAFARSLAASYGTVSGIFHALRSAVNRDCAAAAKLRPLAEHSPLARDNGTHFPILQGPMTRVSDVPAFAESVAEGGALPFLALAVLRGPEVKALLADAKVRLAGVPWGVGVLGFLPPELREEQMEVVREVKPPFALVAGGRPDHARALEAQGTRTYLHVPSPGLLAMFLQQGARRFVFEGRECGGHVGPRTSFVLWNQMVDVLLASREVSETPEELHVVFAAGIHDALSSAMVAAIAAPLAERGVRVGVLVGTAYLFTEEAVTSGAIQPGFQEHAARCQQTVLLETGPGHASRCVMTPFAEAFLQEKRRLIAAGASPDEIRNTLEDLNLGRLRIASKGITRHPNHSEDPDAPRFLDVSAEDQSLQGMYMIGQVASLRQGLCTVQALHEDIAIAGSERLDGVADTVWTAPPSNRPAEAPSDVAIIGMSCLLPKAPDLQTFWENILHKVDAVTEVPAERWDLNLYFDSDPKSKDKIYSKWGGFLDDVHFDPMKYGMPPSTLRSIEPAQLLTLEVVRSALKDAGYLDREFGRERTSVILGAGGGAADLGLAYGARSFVPVLETLPEFQGRSAEILESLGDRLPQWTEDSFAGILTNVSAGRVANRFDLGGSNYTVDAACASSLAAVALAVKELETRASDMVIVGGIDTMQNPFTYLCFSKTKALSPRGRCRTFDESADGIAISEGIAMLVLKRLEDAERDGDRIYAVIKGAASSSDGKDRGLTAPRPEGQARALRRAYAKADVSPSTVELIEAHGTGTVAGDGAEVQALSKVFADAGAEAHGCAIGSVKSMVGHTKCAAGAVGLLKATLALHHKVLPPTLGVQKPNARAHSSQSPFFVNTEAKPWMRGVREHPRRAGVSAFGFGGTNFHVVVEEYTANGTAPASDACRIWTDELFVFGSDSKDGLLRDLQRWSKALEHGTSAPLRDLAFTAWKDLEKREKGKKQALHIAIVATSADDLTRKLTVAEEALARGQATGIADRQGIYFAERPLASEGKTAFLFPGQGSQYPHMLEDLLLLFPEMRTTFETAERVLRERLEKPLTGYIFPPSAFSNEETEQHQKALTDTRIAQPALGAADLAMFGLLQELGLRADMMAGHSYGELAALAAAGVLSTEDLIALSEARGRYIVQAAGDESGSMAAVDANAETTRGLLAAVENVWLANSNAPKQTVVSGTRAAIAQAVAECKAKGVAARAIPVACAFHSPIVAGAQEPLASFLATLRIGSPEVNVYSNTTAKPYPREPDAIAARLVEHLVAPVAFTDEIEAMYAAGARLFVEVGPRGVLSGLVDKTLGDRPQLAMATNQNGKPGLPQLLHTLAQLAAHGAPLRLGRLFRDRTSRQLDLAALPRTGDESPAASVWLVNGARAKPYAEVTQAKSQPAGPKRTMTPNTQNSGGMASREMNHAASTPKPHAAEATVATRPEAFEVATAHIPRAIPPAQPAAHPSTSAPITAGTPLLDGAPDVMAQFQRTMSLFLDTQKSVLMTFLGSEAAGETAVTKQETAVRQPAAELASAAITAPAPSVPVPEPIHAVTEHFRSHASRYPVDGGTPPLQKTAKAQPQATSIASPAIPETTATTAKLLEIVSERTGYPIEMLDLTLDLESDLGIDSIKRVEILGTFQQGFAGAVNAEGLLERLAGIRTLQGIVDAVAESSATHAAPVPVPDTVAAQATPDATGKQASTEFAREQITATLLTIVSERTGYPAEMLDLALDLEADLGIDSIKRVEILGTLQQSYAGSAAADGLMERLAGIRTLEGIIRVLAEGAETESTAMAVPVTATTEHKPQGAAKQSPAAGREDVTAQLLSLVSERTGYPVEMLDLDLDLESDLGIDSIKRIEILGNFQQMLAATALVQAEGVMEQLASVRTLRGILDAVEREISAVPAKQKDVPTSPVTAPASANAATTPPRNSAVQDNERIQRFTVAPVAAPLMAQQHALAGQHAVLITEDVFGIARALAEKLRDRGYKVALTRAGQAIAEIKADEYAADLCSPEGARRLLDLISQRQAPVGAIVHLSPLQGGPAYAESDEGAWLRSLQLGTESLFSLANAAGKQLRKAGREQGASLLAVTGMGGTFMISPEAVTNYPEHGGVAGLTKTLALEWPEVVVKAIDLDIAGDPEVLAEHLLQELTHNDGLVEVGYSNGQRVTLELQAVPLHATNEPKLALDASSVVLVTGGARGIAAEAALQIARKYGSAVVLAGRSPEPEPKEATATAGKTSLAEIKEALIAAMRERDGAVTPSLVEKAHARLKAERDVRATLGSLRQTGSRVFYRQVDVRDTQAFGELIDSIYEQFGRLDGVIHAAGVIEDRLVQDKSLDSFQRVLHTKADSAFTLSRKLRPQDLKFLVFFSSVSGRFGNRGQGDYAAGNEVMTKLAVCLDRTWPGRVVSIDWGPWDNAGMVTPEVRKQFAERGIALIPMETGIRRLEEELSLGRKGAAEVVIGGMGWQPAEPKVKAETLPLIASAVPFRMNGHFEWLREFSLTRDLYLDDHRIDGKPVVPLAFITELIAEAAAQVAPELHVVAVHDLRVLQGIVLDEAPGTLRIVATPASGSNAQESTSVAVEIHSMAQPGRVHYRGTVLLAGHLPPAQPVHLATIAGAHAPRMSMDAMYKQWLFHGPLLQGIQHIDRMGSHGIEARLMTARPDTLITGTEASAWLFDPLLFDSALQLLLIWAREHWDMTALPSGFKSFQRLAPPSGPEIACHLKIRPETGSRVIHSDIYFHDVSSGKIVGFLEDMQGACSSALNRLAAKPANVPARLTK